ncbi:MAG: sugar kinase [Deltaproteobacteria bacterium]|nr:sugar kinase [Deltaproteobacteria bacterium]
MIPGVRYYDVVGVGECSVDQMCVVPRTPTPGEKLELRSLQMQGGGQIATAMVACSRLGLNARYVGAVGDDAAGHYTIEELRSEAVDASQVRVVPGGRTRQAVVLVDANTGERTVLWHADPAVVLHPEDVSDDIVHSGHVLHLDGTMPDVALSCARRARAAGTTVSVDLDAIVPGVEELVSLADLCVVPITFAREFTGANEPASAVRRFAARCQGFIAITLGASGALTHVGGAVVHVPAFPVPAVDTTGCGDVFHAAAIVASLRGLPPRDILRFANAAAALAARGLGARASCPTVPEVQTLLRSG